MKKIYLTVDTECHDIKKENQYIWGIKNGKEYGIGRILELGKLYGIPVNFFVDFAEEKRYGRVYIQKIIDKINEYNQPVYLHLHPNYISGDDRRTFLWEYNKEEQRSILIDGISIYKDIMGKKPFAFRAGRYGVDKDSYDLLNELIPGVVECSYTGGFGKMCHIEKELVGSINCVSKYRSMVVLPNCSFIAFDLCGKTKKVGVDASEMCLTEFEEFLHAANGNDFVLTMHSWNFIERYFWSKHHVGNHKENERLFRGMVQLSKKYGYEFESIEKLEFNEDNLQEDIYYNSANSAIKKIRSLFINYWRFQQMAKISKKFFIIYGIFYAILLTFVFVLLLNVLI